ncbi:MAG: hypothetical protein JJE48_08730 [Actinobacteria bacterium]|nr:hypothetical protein [Actinomycetota bacterium]
MRRFLIVLLQVVLALFLFQSFCLAHEEPEKPTPTGVEESAPAAPGTSAPDESGAHQDEEETTSNRSYEIRHDIVRWLAYFLLALIVLTVASGFVKGKKIYRTIHHGLAFTTLAVALSHGILALTL